MRLLSVYCVELNGSALSPAQCSQLVALQGSQLILLLLSMKKVLYLAGGRTRGFRYWNEVDVVLFVLHLTSVVAAAACSVAVAGVASLRHSSASLVVGASVAVAVWSFYAVEIVLEFLQHKRGCKVVTLVVVLLLLRSWC
ncbi:hypothetical protein GQ600_20511 [Phytophthora cactorum]|nr:hypothetical protein GQ600_20511 [Phytophthora cactorum]